MTSLKEILAFNHLIDRFRHDINDKWDYSFKCINPADYELDLIYTAKGNILRSLFRQVSKVLARVNQRQFSKLAISNPDLIESFDVPEEMLSRVNTAVQSNVKQVANVVKQDGIIILRSKTEKCSFILIKDKEDTLTIKVKVVGQYARKYDR